MSKAARPAQDTAALPWAGQAGLAVCSGSVASPHGFVPLAPPQHLPRGRKTLDQELHRVAGLHPIFSSKFRMKGQKLRARRYCMSNGTTVSIFSLLQVLVCWTLGHQPFPAASFQMPYVSHSNSFQYLLWHPCSRFSLLV